MSRLHFILVLALVTGCSDPPPPAPLPDELVIIGTLGQRHLDSERYPLEDLRSAIRRINPDFVLCEVPPTSLDSAQREWRETGTITEPRVAAFPEYCDVLLPLQQELGFTIIPCSAWTTELEQQRAAGLARLETDNLETLALAQESLDWIAGKLAESDLQTPAGIHSDEYDEIVRLGMGKYAELLDEHLEAGGWQRINDAHFALIDAALRSRPQDGRRYLLMFSAWNKYWFAEKLADRRGLRLENATEFFE